MKIETNKLTGHALDWAVAKSDGYLGNIRRTLFGCWQDLERTQVRDDDYTEYSPSTDWEQGGEIIERECIVTQHDRRHDLNQPWRCALSIDPYNLFEGSTPLIAAMRCFVASKLGDEIEIPEDLA
jgi:hypothetical protein